CNPATTPLARSASACQATSLFRRLSYLKKCKKTADNKKFAVFFVSIIFVSISRWQLYCTQRLLE
ncbi:MAG TPA: hypothetical protein VNI60_09215, partial [Pyrinomonadaceae bacterium]|nr:hypothetical protein [Pyrinomonadaceae bacterium]